MPDSSLRVRLCFFFHHHSKSARRSRMTAGVNCVFLGSKYLPVILERSEESRQRIRVLNTLYRLSYAGFFAKSQIMFFLPSLFRFCPPLKNDGRGELRFREVVNDFSPKKKSTGNVSCPRLSGKVSTDRLTKGVSVSRNVRTKK